MRLSVFTPRVLLITLLLFGMLTLAWVNIAADEPTSPVGGTLPPPPTGVPPAPIQYQPLIMHEPVLFTP